MRNIFFIMVFLLLAMDSYAQEGADPTEPTQPGDYSESIAGVNNTGSRGLRLNAIFSQSNNSTAVVNGKVLREGESVDGYKITTISKNSVTLKSKTNESFELKFLDFNVKQPHQ